MPTADITMLTLDGSEAGAAIFNSTITGTALTIDDVVIDGKVMTMTGSSSDTAGIYCWNKWNFINCNN